MKQLKIFFLIAIAVLFVTSCSTVKDELGFSSKSGVSFNKLSISESDLDADLKAIANNKPLAKTLAESGTPLVDNGKVTATYRASWVNIQLQILAIREAREAKKMKINDKDRKSAEEDAKGLFAEAGSDDAKAIWKAFPKSFKDRLIEGYAEQGALLRAAGKVTDKEVKAYFKENEATFTECASGKTTSHILVETQETADKVKAEIAAGKDFGDLAKKYSTDPGSKDKKGDLGCFVEGQFVEAFENVAKSLEPGKVSDIVKTDYGFHIIKSIQFVKPTVDDVKDEIVSTLEPEKQSKLFTDVENRLKKAKIKVSKKYGKVSTGEDGIPSIVPIDSVTTTTSPQTQETVPTS